MLHQVSERHNAMIAAVELLNDLGMNLIYIDGAFYTFSEFIPADDINHYITMRGKNVTKFIETSLNVTGLTKQRQIEIFQEIEVKPERLREYSKDTKWIKYVGKGL